jgi:hypothetical protein
MASPVPISPQAGDDKIVGSDLAGQLTVINAIRAYREESETSRRQRLFKNRENRQAYMGLQDWTHKQKGQSEEFVPKVPVAVEQFSAFAKRALTQFGAWYDIELAQDSRSPLSGAKLRNLLECFTEDLLTNDNIVSSLALQISDGIKMATMEAVFVIKIHGSVFTERVFDIKEEKMTDEEANNWRLRADLVPSENYYPDPSGEGLYEIHRIEKDLSYVKEKAAEGIYSQAAVDRIVEDFTKKEYDKERRPQEKGHDYSAKPGFRKKVQLDEFWGTIVDASGNVIHRNVFCTIANDKYLIREPTPNPFWHQESPFVVIPLLRVPLSVWHKAIMDHASPLNFALNEIFNLMLDGGLASVWGIKQLRAGALEDPREVTDGIHQGQTLTVNNTLAPGEKVVEIVAQGQVPADAQIMYENVSREFAAAALSNELKLGALPSKQVKATEIVELSQSQAVTLDGIVSDVERGLSRLLRKCLLVSIQHLDEVQGIKVVNAVGLRAAFALSQIGPGRLFATLADNCSFKVHGLSATLAKARDFQKMAALMQLVAANPMMMQAFFSEFSPTKILNHMMKSLSINPEQIKKDSDEIERSEIVLEQMAKLQAMASGQGGGGNEGAGGAGVGADQTGEASLPAEINQASNPLTGLGADQ